MSTTKYSKYRPDLFDDFDIADLLEGLSDYFLDSGLVEMCRTHLRAPGPSITKSVC